MKPCVAFLPAGRDACALFRMFLPHLKMAGSVFLYNEYGMDPKSFAHCQVAVVQRLYSKSNFAALQMLKQMGLKVVYDLDDDMWSVPSYNPAHKIFRQILSGFNICASMADALSVSTEHLKVIVRQELGKKCPPIYVVENAIDFEWFKPLPENYRKEKKDRVVVGWAGTNTHSGDVKEVFNLIPEMLDELPQMDFEVVGLEPPDSWERFGSRVRRHDYVPVAEFASYWPSWQWDLSIAPLEKNKFNLSKSSIKLLEASALGIPCVATKIGSYTKFAQNSKMLPKYTMAETKSDWKRKIRDLVLSKELRLEVGAEMMRVGKENYNIVDTVKKWGTIFEEITGG